MEKCGTPLDVPDDENIVDRRLDADLRLDMELEQTFPASDPIPWIHEIGRRISHMSKQDVRRWQAMNKEAVRARMLSLSETEFQQAKQGYAAFLESAMLDRTESARRDDASMAEAASELAEAFDQPIHTSAEKLAKLKGIDFGPKNHVAEGAIVNLNGRFLVVAVPTSRFVCDGQSFMGISTEAPIYRRMQGLREGDRFTFGGNRFTIEQLG
jgi:hypothetical protein